MWSAILREDGCWASPVRPAAGQLGERPESRLALGFKFGQSRPCTDQRKLAKVDSGFGLARSRHRCTSNTGQPVRSPRQLSTLGRPATLFARCPFDAGAVLSHDILWLLVFATANELEMAQVHSTNETSRTSFGFTHRSSN